MTEPDLFTPLPYGGHAAYARGAETSIDAARAATVRMRADHEAILAALRRSPMTPDELALYLNMDILNVRPRCTELKEMKLVERTGERRVTRHFASYVLRAR